MIKLKSGKEIYANGGFVGINDDIEIAQGYDGNMPYTRQPDWMGAEEWQEVEKLSSEEQIELADRMIALWKTFRDKAME